ncbi:MAG: methyltransferase [Chloroflexota bacterium]
MATWPSTPGDELIRLFRSFWVSRAIYVAAELGIADLLAEGPLAVDDLASAVGAHAPTLYRILRLLASEGVFIEAEDGSFALTPPAAALRRDAGPARLQVLFIGRDASWQAAGSLLHSVRTGETAFEHVHGVDFFEHLRHHPDEQALFDQLMVGNTVPVARAVAAEYDFSGIRSIVDVGGGRGALALEILRAHPHIRGIVFDQPAVVAGARDAIEAEGLADRCEAVGGDFFVAVPDGCDAYLLKYVLHDWDDERSLAILRACRRAMQQNGRLLVVELRVPRGNVPSFATSSDVNMLINLGGQERTEDEYSRLFAAAGFDLTRTVPLQGELHIIEGVPV